MAQNGVRLLLSRVAAWNQTHPHQQIDPAAELAVARQEGLSGGIGDGGHAFGPNQLNNAGGVLTGKFQGMSPEQINRWAWSPQGIDYALAGVANVAGGERGGRAVQDIVARFERPANIPREVTNALAAYGGQDPTGTMAQPHQGAAQSVAQALTRPQPAADPRGALLAALSGAGGDYAGFYGRLGQALQQRNQPPPQETLPGSLVRPPVQTLPGRPGQQPPVQTLPDRGLKLAAVPLTLATRGGIQVDQRVLPQVQQIAQQFGVRANSGFRSGEHNAQVGGASNSDHLRGDAVDFTGSPQQMQQLYRWAQGRFPYVEPWAQASGNHVHISFRR